MLAGGLARLGSEGAVESSAKALGADLRSRAEQGIRRFREDGCGASHVRSRRQCEDSN